MCIALQEDTTCFGGARTPHTGRQGQREGGGGCGVAHHDVDCEVWAALHVHFEGVVKCQGDLTLKPVRRANVVQGEVEGGEEQAKSTGLVFGVFESQATRHEVRGVWCEVHSQFMTLC